MLVHTRVRAGPYEWRALSLPALSLPALSPPPQFPRLAIVPTRACARTGSGEVSREEWRHGFYQAGFDGTAVVGQSIEGLSVLLNLVSAPRLTSYGGASIRAFDDLSNGRPACRIARAEERGITLSQLRTLWEHVQCRCVPEGWMDVHGAPLTPERVDLYDVLRYVVKPATRAATCSYVERVAVRPQLPSWVVVHWWGQPLAEVVACLEAHTRDRGVSDAAGSYWLAAFALNQHQQGGVFDDAAWQAMQQATHLSCGTVAVVDREGSAFKRVCLLYELLAAVRCNQASGGRASAHKLDIYVYMPHIDRKRCVSAAIGLTDGFAMSDFAQSETNKMRRESVFPLALIETALRLRVQDGHAATEADKRRILRTLTHSFHVERERASLHRRVAAAGAGAADEHEGVDVEKDDSEDPLQPANQTLHARIALAALRVVIDAQHSPRGRRSGSPSSIGSPQSGSPPGSPEAGGGRPGGALGPLSSLHAASSRPLLEGCLEALSLGRLAVIQLSLSNCAAFDATTAGALARALPPALERLVLYYHDVEPVAADCFVEGLSQALGFGRLPTMRHVGLFSNMFSDTAGYALSNALRTAPKTLRSLDFGSPVPFSYPRIADAIVSIRSPLTLSYYGEERMSGTGLNVSGMGLSTCDVILLIATASRGVPEKLRALDLSRNPLQNAAITVLVKAIAADSLPHLHYVDLSGACAQPVLSRNPGGVCAMCVICLCYMCVVRHRYPARELQQSWRSDGCDARPCRTCRCRYAHLCGCRRP